MIPKFRAWNTETDEVIIGNVYQNPELLEVTEW